MCLNHLLRFLRLSFTLELRFFSGVASSYSYTTSSVYCW